MLKARNLFPEVVTPSRLVQPNTSSPNGSFNVVRSLVKVNN